MYHVRVKFENINSRIINETETNFSFTDIILYIGLVYIYIYIHCFQKTSRHQLSPKIHYPHLFVMYNISTQYGIV